jgi:predicted CxxxxCH...CXXCH cytochrome family protein
METSENSMKTFIRYGIIFVVTIGSITGCSQLKNETTPVSPTLPLHGVGFRDTTSTNFHGIAIRAQKQPWNVQVCRSCHGLRYDGGTAGQSCLTCHNKPNGPENCTTCHGGANAAPWRDLSGNTQPTIKSVGAHQAHLVGGSIGADVDCNVCHTVSEAAPDAGHFDNGATQGKFDTTTVFYRSGASYNSSTATCSNTYCHGNFSGGNHLTISWTDTSSAAGACGTCHGDVTKTTLEEKALPKNNHPAVGTAKCNQCHSSVVDSNLNFTGKSRHINGAVNFN